MVNHDDTIPEKKLDKFETDLAWQECNQKAKEDMKSLPPPPPYEETEGDEQQSNKKSSTDEKRKSGSKIKSILKSLFWTSSSSKKKSNNRKSSASIYMTVAEQKAKETKAKADYFEEKTFQELIKVHHHIKLSLNHRRRKRMLIMMNRLLMTRLNTIKRRSVSIIKVSLQMRVPCTILKNYLSFLSQWNLVGEIKELIKLNNDDDPMDQMLADVKKSLYDHIG